LFEFDFVPLEKIKFMKTICFILVLCFSTFSAIAQESINSIGSEATGSGGTVAYSIGQAVYTYESGTNGNISQGVQQPYEIYSVGIKETTLDISLSVFPNPTTDNLTLQITDYNNEKLTYQLFDLSGKLLSNGQIITQQTKINTTNLPSTTYFIKVINQENNQFQSFKIIKN
jgi:opacity protein-like surface antigen